MKVDDIIDSSDSEEERVRLILIQETVMQPSRRLIVISLIDEPRTLSDIISETGLIYGDTKYHMGTLLDMGILGRDSVGKSGRYSITPDLVETVKVVLYPLKGLV